MNSISKGFHKVFEYQNATVVLKAGTKDVLRSRTLTPGLDDREAKYSFAISKRIK